MALSPGFQSERVLSGHVSLPGTSYSEDAARLAFTDRLMAELETPAGSSCGRRRHQRAVERERHQERDPGEGYVLARPVNHCEGTMRTASTATTSRALGIPLTGGTVARGRRHRGAAPRTCRGRRGLRPSLLAARRGASGSDCSPGREEGSDAEAFTIVGVVGAVEAGRLDRGRRPRARSTIPTAHALRQQLFVVGRTSLPSESLGATLRRRGARASTPTWRSATSVRWTRGSARAWSPVARPPSSPASSPAWRCCSPRSAPTAC